MINEYEEIVCFLEKLNKYIDKAHQVDSLKSNKAIAKRLPAFNNKLQKLIGSLESVDADDYEKIHELLQEIHYNLSSIRCHMVQIRETFEYMAHERMEPLEQDT